MKHLKRYSYSVGLLLTAFLLMAVIPISFGAPLNDGQVQVPLIVDVSYAIAGAEFAFEYSAGLEFVSYEKSAVVSSAMNTPVVVKNGRTYVGFYNVDNRYVPENGKLDVGYLVFNSSSDASQLVKLTEIKLVQVIDKDTTRSTLLAPVEIKISPENNTENSSANSNSNSDGSGSNGGSSNNSSSSNGGASSSGTKNSSIADSGNVSSTDTKNPPENAGDGPLSTDTKDSPVDNSKSSLLSPNFWFIFVLLVIACGAGIFIFLKKVLNTK